MCWVAQYYVINAYKTRSVTQKKVFFRANLMFVMILCAKTCHQKQNFVDLKED
jgi:hypothetical protein